MDVSQNQMDRNGEKLDKIKDDMGEVRVTLATLAGDVSSITKTLAKHDEVDADVERRLRGLERRSYAIPSLAAILGALGFILALWTSIQSGRLG